LPEFELVKSSFDPHYLHINTKNLKPANKKIRILLIVQYTAYNFKVQVLKINVAS